MKRSSYIYICLLLATITSCKKSTIVQVGDAASGAQIKFVHAAAGTPAIDGFVNNVKITPSAVVTVTDNQVVSSITTGLSYSYLGSAATYLALFPGSNYAAVPAGSTVIKVATSTPTPALITAQTSAAGATLGTVTQSTTSGSAYSVFAMGLAGSSTAPLGIKVTEDKFPDAASGKAYVRFAYMVPNGAAVDVKSTYTPTGGAATTAVMVGNITYSTVTDFVAVNVNPSGTTNYTFQMFLTTTATALGPVSAAIALAPGRYYTVVARGLAADYPVPGTSIVLKSTARPISSTDPNAKLPEIYFNPISMVYYTNK